MSVSTDRAPAVARGGLNTLDAVEAAAMIADGRITSQALVTACLERIAARDARIGAWAHVDPDRALAQARAADASSGGLLRGVPVGVKDIFDTADMPTAYGSAIHRGHRPERDTACVAALRAAGAVMLGKTTTTEFASPVPVGVVNPRAPARSPGVSSSGSAAAVADDMVPVALGSQTGGSMIMPASSCGVFGYKASLEGIARTGLRHLRPTLDTIGIFARSLADIARTRAALTDGPSARTLAARPPRRIGLCRTPAWEVAEPATRTAIDEAARLLRTAGADVADFELPEGFDAMEDAFGVISAVEGGRALAWEAGAHRDALNGWIRDQIALGERLGAAACDAARARAGDYRRALARKFAAVDLILTPSAPGEPTVDLSGLQVSVFNRIWTLMHTPCLSVPAFRGPNGAPVGIQLVAPVGADDRLLEHAAWVAARLPLEPVRR